MSDDSAHGPAESGGTPSDDEPTVDPFAGPEWEQTRRRYGMSASGGTRSTSASRTGASGRRRRTPERHRKVRLRRVLLGSGLVVGLLVIAVGWLLYTGLEARHELQIVRADVHRLRAQIAAGDLDSAQQDAMALRAHADRAHSLTSDPVWSAAAAVPIAGTPLSSARTLTTAVSSIAADAVPQLVRASNSLDPNSLRRPDGSIDLAQIASVAPALTTATGTLSRATESISATPSSTWLGPVNAARSDLLEQLSGLTTTVRSADVAARVLPPMLGADGPRDYMVSFQNEAELRGLAGLPGAFAILHVDNGRFSFTKFESDNELIKVPTALNFGTDYDQLYNAYNPTTDYRDSNVSPNFPYAARVWLAEWQRKSGEQLDGALTLDPTALSYLLRVTGPAKLPDGGKVSGKNVVALTEHDAYIRFGTKQTKRKQFLLGLARVVSRHLIDTTANTTSLVREASKAVSQYRLSVYSRHPDVERLLARTKISGVVPDTSGPYAGLAINNAGANKLDYYLHGGLSWQRSGCGVTRDVTVTIRLRNGAPANLPKSILGFTGRPGLPQVPGDNRLLVSYFATKGSAFTKVTLDGRASTAGSTFQRGRPVFSVLLNMPRGRTQTLVLHLDEPAASGGLTVRPQPMVNPLQVRTGDASCG